MEKLATPLERYEYNIDENNVLRIWDKEFVLENDAPNLYQDVDTETGEPFANNEAVVAWLNNWVQAAQNAAAHAEQLLANQDTE
jgi:hypothetical protein